MATTDVVAHKAATDAERSSDTLDDMPSWEIFERYCRDHPEYREQVLPQSVAARVSVEKASTLGWARYVGGDGRSIGMETFGASAPLAALQKKFGFTPQHIVEAARQQIARVR